MFPPALHPWIATAAVLLVFASLQWRRGGPTDLIFLGGLMLVTLTGVITPSQAFSGFANHAVIAIAALLTVSAGLRSAGVLDWLGRRWLGPVEDERGALWRLAPVLTVASAFVLNTALVAMTMPVVLEWCRKRGVSPSRLLMPVSYLAILGGVCTLIGTSTTLVIQGQLRELRDGQNQLAAQTADAELAESRRQFAEHLAPLKFLEPGWVGLPCAVAGFLALVGVSRRLTPNRSELVETFDADPRRYLVELMVKQDCPLAGKTVDEAGLRRLPGLFLIEIDREGEVTTPVAPHHRIEIHDRLVFSGVVSTIVDLEKIPNLIPVADLRYETQPESRQQRRLTEVVLSPSSPLIGRTLREADFRKTYNAAVVAVHRNGEQVERKIGDIRLKAGDTLLLQTRTDFVSVYRNHRDFYLVSEVSGSTPRRNHKAPLAAFWAIVLIAWLIVGNFIDADGPLAGLASAAVAAVTIAGLMVATRCLHVSAARSALDLRTLLTIGAALGLGAALDHSGAAAAMARTLIQWAGDQPHLLLAVVYVLAMVLTETLSNTAVAAIMLPLAASVAWEGGYNPRPFVMAITMAASLAFLTPVGYQTNLMVMGPGGYRPSDYFRAGLPITFAVTLTSLLLIPWLWPLRP